MKVLFPSAGFLLVACLVCACSGQAIDVCALSFSNSTYSLANPDWQVVALDYSWNILKKGQDGLGQVNEALSLCHKVEAHAPGSHNAGYASLLRALLHYHLRDKPHRALPLFERAMHLLKPPDQIWQQAVYGYAVCLQYHTPPTATSTAAIRRLYRELIRRAPTTASVFPARALIQLGVLEMSSPKANRQRAMQYFKQVMEKWPQSDMARDAALKLLYLPPALIADRDGRKIRFWSNLEVVRDWLRTYENRECATDLWLALGDRYLHQSRDYGPMPALMAYLWASGDQGMMVDDAPRPVKLVAERTNTSDIYWRIAELACQLDKPTIATEYLTRLMAEIPADRLCFQAWLKARTQIGLTDEAIHERIDDHWLALGKSDRQKAFLREFLHFPELAEVDLMTAAVHKRNEERLAHEQAVEAERRTEQARREEEKRAAVETARNKQRALEQKLQAILLETTAIGSNVLSQAGQTREALVQIEKMHAQVATSAKAAANNMKLMQDQQAAWTKLWQEKLDKADRSLQDAKKAATQVQTLQAAVKEMHAQIQTAQSNAQQAVKQSTAQFNQAQAAAKQAETASAQAVNQAQALEKAAEQSKAALQATEKERVKTEQTTREARAALDQLNKQANQANDFQQRILTNMQVIASQIETSVKQAGDAARRALDASRQAEKIHGNAVGQADAMKKALAAMEIRMQRAEGKLNELAAELALRKQEMRERIKAEAAKKQAVQSQTGPKEGAR